MRKIEQVISILLLSQCSFTPSPPVRQDARGKQKNRLRRRRGRQREEDSPGELLVTYTRLPVSVQLDPALLTRPPTLQSRPHHHFSNNHNSSEPD